MVRDGVRLQFQLGHAHLDRPFLLHRVRLIAPHQARWALRAAAMARALGLHVARLHDDRVVGILLATGTVATVLVDRRSVPASWSTRRTRLEAIAPRARLLVVHDDDQEADDDALPWPCDASAASALLTPR